MQRVLLVLAAAAAAAGIAVTASSGQTSAAGKTIAIYSKSPKDYINTVSVDQPPKATKANPNLITPGDLIFQTVILHNRSGAVIGHEFDQLIFASRSTNYNSVDRQISTFVFADGTIYTIGLHRPGSDAPDAVIGGTGAYAGARGTLAPGGANEDIIHLLP